MTEVNAMALYHDLDEPLELRKLPGVHPAPGLEARVVHPETGAVCKPGEQGELQLRGERVTAPATSAPRTAKGTRSSRARSPRPPAPATSSPRPVRPRRSSCLTRTRG